MTTATRNTARSASYRLRDLTKAERLRVLHRRSHMSIPQVAASLHISAQSFWRYTHHHSNNVPDVTLHAPLTTAEACWIARLRTGLTQKQLGAMLNCSASTIINGEYALSASALGTVLAFWEARGWPQVRKDKAKRNASDSDDDDVAGT